MFNRKDAILLAMERELFEGDDFYREGANIVFTETFLRRRGWCCESGCRHCPWGYRSDQRSDAPVGAASEDEEKS